jgi:hypothetical protein
MRYAGQSTHLRLSSLARLAILPALATDTVSDGLPAGLQMHRVSGDLQCSWLLTFALGGVCHRAQLSHNL